MTGPPVDLIYHLIELAGQVGYDVDVEYLEPVTGWRPDLVTAWARAGGRHATLTWIASLLHAPAVFLREQAAAADPGGVHAQLLAELTVHRAWVDGELARTREAFAAACGRLADAGLGLLWPKPPVVAGAGGRRRAELEAALAQAGFRQVGGVWARTATDGTRAVVTIAHLTQVRVRPVDVPGWQAVFTQATPPAAILATIPA